jgi:hypothetical protein
MNIDKMPVSIERMRINSPGLPPDSFNDCTDSQLGTPVLPK